MFQLLPAPNQPGTVNNYIWTPPGSQTVNQFDVRVDENLGTSDRLFVKFSDDLSTGSGPGTLPPAANPIVPVAQYIALGGGFAGTSTMRDWSLTTNYVKIFGANLVNELRAGAVREYLNNFLVDNNLPIATELGIPNINISNLNQGIPAVTIPGFLSPLFGSTSSYPEVDHTLTLESTDILTWTRGKHTFKFGGDFVRDRFDGHTSNSPRGVFDFNGQFTRQIGSNTSATTLSDFALGAWDGAQRSEQFGIFGARRWRTAAFAEDDWRATNRLTITVGLRYELQAPYHDVFDRWSNLNVRTGQAITPTSANNQCGESTICLDDNNLGPRLGIAYELTGDHKTVLRTGAGISYFSANNGGKMLHQNPPMNIIQQFSTTSTGSPTSFLSQGLPLPVIPNLADPTQLTQLFYAWDPNTDIIKNMQWSFGIQRELLANTMLDVAYVGSRTLDMSNIINANQAMPGPGPLGPRRPLYLINPAVQDIAFRTNYGAAKYHSLQVNLDKRYSHGLTMHLAYTWSKNMSNTAGPNTNFLPQNDQCTRCEWGSVPEDRRQMLVINHVYELPFGTGRQFVNHGFLSYIVGDWDLSGLWSLYSGLHFGPALATSVSGSIGAPLLAPTERPNLNGPGNLPVDQRTITHWFNTAAFSTPAAYTFGNAGVNILEGPGSFSADLGVHRQFPINERVRLTFRWEMFNAFNRPNFQNPSATIGSPTAGVVSATYAARDMQFAMKLNF
jgi:hypothetical protein